ncbi:MAG: DUF4870 domain-containing protein [Burkholderiales bacterium]|nr:DUF4870 domain-containing protein [Burkholderiales bacterium]
MDEIEKITPSAPSKDDCNIAAITHILGIFTGFVGALIIWIIKKDESQFIGDQAKEALNFQIAVMIASFAAGILCMVLIGFLLIPVIVVANLIFCILAAIAASKGENYRYPLPFRLVQ